MLAKTLIWNGPDNRFAAAPVVGVYHVFQMLNRRWWQARLLHPTGVAIWQTDRLHEGELNAKVACQQHADNQVAELLDPDFRRQVADSLGNGLEEIEGLKMDYLASVLVQD